MVRKRRKRKPSKIGKKFVSSEYEYQTFLYLKEHLPRRNIEYETETFDYVTSHKYLPDFKIKTKSGKILYIETKGNGRSFDNSVRQKLIAVRDQHPEIDLRIVFYSDGKIGPKRKDGTFLKQSDWAIKNNFKFSIKTPPLEWLEE